MTNTEHYKYLFDVDEEVKPTAGPLEGSTGRVVYRTHGKLAVVFNWDVAGIPVEFSPHELERA